jgi:hypothetical protein
MPRKLKVFRTSTGFHDAYVAAPSRRAALTAWGADADLFARGVAEEVTDPKLTGAALERPGEVIKVSRGDLAAQIKALGPRKRKAKAADNDAEEPPETPKPRKPAKSKPPPSRDKVDAAEAALAKARERQRAEQKKLEHQRDAIERKLESLRAKQGKETARLERKRDEARETYREALEAWSE